MVVKIVTSNGHRAELLAGCVHALGLDHVHVSAELDEPQADSVSTIARAKAVAAARLVGAPLLVEDSGLSIETLGGFPGPYLKYTLATLGAARLVRLAAGAPCRFTSAIALVSPARVTRVLELSLEGTIATQVAHTGAPDVWRLVVPAGERQPFSELPAPVTTRQLRAWADQITDWLRSDLAP